MSTTLPKQPTRPTIEERADNPTILKHVTVEDLFNLPLYEHHLVIDTRPLEDYVVGHIATAVSYPSPSLDCPDEEKEKGLVPFIKSYIKEYFSPENPSPIVVYGSTQPECLAHAEWLARKLEQLHYSRKTISTINPDETSSPEENAAEFLDEQESKPASYFKQFCDVIADRTHEIWILDGGYQAFQEEYDFLCGNIEFGDMFPLPHQITRHIFLGTRVFPLTKDCLRKLRITHMVVSKCQPLDWDHLEGISVLSCSVHETNSQDMSGCWDASLEFIEEALSNTSARFDSREASEPNTDDHYHSDSEIERDTPALIPATKSVCDDEQTSCETNQLCSDIMTTNTQLTISETENTPRIKSDEALVKNENPIENFHHLSIIDCQPSQHEGCSKEVRILVILFGRSRSTSVILAYLIRTRHMSFEEAWAFVRSKCWHLIDRSLVFEDQLREWGKQTEPAFSLSV